MDWCGNFYKSIENLIKITLILEYYVFDAYVIITDIQMEIVLVLIFEGILYFFLIRYARVC